MRIWSSNARQEEPSLPEPLAFTGSEDNPSSSAPDAPHPASDFGPLPESADRIFDALDNMSRRLEDLARELNCLGYFDDDDDGPRAA